MNHFAFHYESVIDAPWEADIEMLCAVLRIDGQWMHDSIDIAQLVKSTREGGDLEIFTCDCGYAPCSSIYPIGVLHTGDIVEWAIREPSFGSEDAGPDTIYRRFKFNREAYTLAIAKALAFAKHRQLISPHRIKLVPYGLDNPRVLELTME